MGEERSRLPRKRPTQERARRTVDAILEAAAEVFDAHGFDGGTTERIVERAGVSVGSLYQYFPNKEALLAALVERYCDEVQGLQRDWLAWLAAERPPIDEGLRAYVDWLVASHAVRPRLRCLMFEERPAPPGMAATRAATVDGLATWLEGRVRQPAVAAQVLSRAVSSLVHQLVLHPVDEIPVEVASEEVFVLARAYLAAVAMDSVHDS